MHIRFGFRVQGAGMGACDDIAFGATTLLNKALPFFLVDSME
jgi:hypothetical protein